jgi:hypothetical protein
MTTKLTTVVSVRLKNEDVAWLKDYIAQYPGDTLGAMLTRFIEGRIDDLKRGSF